MRSEATDSNRGWQQKYTTLLHWVIDSVVLQSAATIDADQNSRTEWRTYVKRHGTMKAPD